MARFVCYVLTLTITLRALHKFDSNITVCIYCVQGKESHEMKLITSQKLTTHKAIPLANPFGTVAMRKLLMTDLTMPPKVNETMHNCLNQIYILCNVEK